MRLYNNNSAFGDGGPFDFDGDDFDAACEAFADEMADNFRTWAAEYADTYEYPEIPTLDIDPYEENKEAYEAVRAQVIARKIDSMRAEFIAGLTEVQ